MPTICSVIESAVTDVSSIKRPFNVCKVTQNTTTWDIIGPGVIHVIARNLPFQYAFIYFSMATRFGGGHPMSGTSRCFWTSAKANLPPAGLTRTYTKADYIKQSRAEQVTSCQKFLQKVIVHTWWCYVFGISDPIKGSRPHSHEMSHQRQFVQIISELQGVVKKSFGFFATTHAETKEFKS